jgi:EAL domain-containing protein (putative c-di-GMP-specific phosphodiesterase class I)/ActR/RegA family two-component response regulator
MQAILVVDDDDAIREGLGEALYLSGRTVITCSDIESAQVVVENEPIGAVVCDVRLSGPLSIDGIDFIDHVHAQRADSKVVVMSGAGVAEMPPEALRHGATQFLAKPFNVSDLECTLGWEEELAPTLSHVPPLLRILGSPLLVPRFQPIVATGSLAHFAYEGLIRLTGAATLGNPELLFEYARRKRGVPALEMACVDRTMIAGAPLAIDDRLLFINASPLSFGDKSFAQRVLDNARRAGLPLDRLVLEITEQNSFPAGHPNGTIEMLAREGVRFAFDDVGSAYSHLAYIDVIRPQFLKISKEFGIDFERDATKEKIVRNIIALAADFGCATILEGVETEATLVAARELGIPLAQGYYFARPAAVETFM